MHLDTNIVHIEILYNMHNTYRSTEAKTNIDIHISRTDKWCVYKKIDTDIYNTSNIDTGTDLDNTYTIKCKIYTNIDNTYNT